MNKSKILLIFIVLILLAGNVFWGVKYFSIVKEFRQTQVALDAQVTNEKILDFTKLFIEKVLKSETEVDFETRLKLENAVRILDDEQIFLQWQKFVESQTEADAQTEVKNLLEILINKIKIK